MKTQTRQKKMSARIPREDGDATKAKIIEAAGRLFAERGYAETTSKEICKAAKTNITAVNYHFGSREGLYQEVVKVVLNFMVDAKVVEKITTMEGSPEDRLALFIEEMVEVDRNSWQLRLWAREAMAPSQAWQENICAEKAPRFDGILRIISDMTGIPIDAKEMDICFFFILTPLMAMKLAKQDTHMKKIPISKYDYKDVIVTFKTFVFAGLKEVAKNYTKKEANNADMKHTCN